MTSKTSSLTKTALGAALLSVSAWIAVPVGAVPFTLQTLVLFLLFALLGGKVCAQAVTAYLALGAFGLPVFAGFQSGIGALFGATGGYLLGFLAATLVMWGLERLFVRKGVFLVISMIAGLLACYTFGTAWFLLVYGGGASNSLAAVLAVCVLPYLPADALKIALAVLLSRRLRPQIKTAGR